MSVRVKLGHPSRPLSSHPWHFVYFTAAEKHVQYATYHEHLVVAEVLLQRLMRSRARGIRPVRLHLREDAQSQLLPRTRQDTCSRSSAEYVRWVDCHGNSRAQPLDREQLARELIDQQGISLARAIELVMTDSRALACDDQAWLLQRARLPVLERPLDGAEYQTLVRAIEGVHAVPDGSCSSCAVNAEIALRMARGLGWLHEDYTASPFRVSALSMAYKLGHHDYLTRRAAFICATGQRLRFSGAKPRMKMEAKLAEQRASHAAYLARRAMAATAELSAGKLPVPEASGGTRRSWDAALPSPATFRRTLAA